MKFWYDVIPTSKWRNNKIPVYGLWKSVWRHYDVTSLSNIFENLNLAS